MQDTTHKNRRGIASMGGALCAALMIASCGETTPEASPSLGNFLKSGDCESIGKSAPPMSVSLSTVSSLASECRSAADNLPADRSSQTKANILHNAAVLFASIGDRHQGTNTASAASAYNTAHTLITQSRQAVPDDKLTLSGVAGDRYKFSRLAVLAASDIERGLLNGSSANLRSGLGVFDSSANARLLSLAGSDPEYDVFATYQTLLLRQALGQSKLADLSNTYSGVETAMVTLSRVAADAGAAGMSGLAAAAEDAVLDVATTHAGKLLAGTASSAACTQAIGYLESAKRAANRAGLNDENHASVLAMLGDAYLRRASLSNSVTADNAADFCAAANAYRDANAVGGSSPAALTGRGVALARLATASVSSPCGSPGSSLRDAALTSFDSAWATSKSAFSSNARTQYAGLLSTVGKSAKASEVLSSVSGGSPSAADLQTLLDIAARSSGDEKIKYLNKAKDADSKSPLPYLRAAKYYASSNPANLSQADSQLSTAVSLARGNTQKYAANLAEASYLRSDYALRGSGQSMRNAAEWAEDAVQANTSSALSSQYEAQACRAHILARTSPSEASRYCANKPNPTAEGALLHAFFEFRKSQIERKAKPNFGGAFSPAEDAFETAQGAISRLGASSQRVSWPGVTANVTYAQAAKFGEQLSSVCRADQNDNVDPPSQTQIDTVGPLFTDYGLDRCNSF